MMEKMLWDCRIHFPENYESAREPVTLSTTSSGRSGGSSSKASSTSLLVVIVVTVVAEVVVLSMVAIKVVQCYVVVKSKWNNRTSFAILS